MNGQYGKKSNLHSASSLAGQFGKLSKSPNGNVNHPTKEIEETIPETNDIATIEEIESVEEAMNGSQNEEIEEVISELQNKEVEEQDNNKE